MLIADYMPFNISPSVIKEAVENNKRIIVSGKIQSADLKNANNRIYPRKILEREISNFKKLIEERRSLGELDHPDSENINLHNVSHLILDVWWKDNDLYADIEILNTPAGNILKSLIEANVTLGISSRGVGSVTEVDSDGTVRVNDDFKLITWDFVSNPSTHGAFMRPIKINESIENNNYSVAVCRNKVECLIRDILIELNKK